MKALSASRLAKTQGALQEGTEKELQEVKISCFAPDFMICHTQVYFGGEARSPD
jgi:hypothetical protein